MFARISTLFMFMLFALPLLAAASAVPRGDTPASQCNTGDLQCCDSVQNPRNPSNGLRVLAGLLSVVLIDLTGLVGITCSPISVIGIGGNSCAAQPVCCTNNSFNGLIALGCSPVDLNL